MKLDEIGQIVNMAVRIGLVGVIWKGIKAVQVWADAKKKAKHKEIEILEDHQKEQDVHLVLFSNALVALLHYQVYTLATQMIDKGEVTYEDLDELDYCYKPYRALGGNGTGEKLYNKVQELPIVGKDKQHE